MVTTPKQPSIFTRLATLTDAFAARKLGRDAHEAKARAWKLAAELQVLETRLPIARAELAQAVDALDKAVNTPAQPVKEEGKK